MADPVSFGANKLLYRSFMKTKNPRCCFCSYELDDDETCDSINEMEDEDESKVVCPNCGKTFGVRCVHKIRFVQIDADGDEI